MTKGDCCSNIPHGAPHSRTYVESSQVYWIASQVIWTLIAGLGKIYLWGLCQMVADHVRCRVGETETRGAKTCGATVGMQATLVRVVLSQLTLRIRCTRSMKLFPDLGRALQMQGYEIVVRFPGPHSGCTWAPALQSSFERGRNIRLVLSLKTEAFSDLVTV